MAKPYVSEFTLFLEELKRRDPGIEKRQLAGRALLWDKPYDARARKDAVDSNVPQRPYVYGSLPGPADPKPKAP